MPHRRRIPSATKCDLISWLHDLPTLFLVDHDRRGAIVTEFDRGSNHRVGSFIHLGQRSGMTTWLKLLRGKTQVWPRLHFIVIMVLILRCLSLRAAPGMATRKFVRTMSLRRSAHSLSPQTPQSSLSTFLKYANY